MPVASVKHGPSREARPQVREPATKKENLIKRCVAQFGRALRSGRRGRRFESCRIDWLKIGAFDKTFFQKPI